MNMWCAQTKNPKTAIATEEKATAVYPKTRLREKVLMTSEMTPNAGQNHDVHSRVRVEPEQVLEEQWIATLGRIEDSDADHALQDHEDQGNGQHRRAQHHQDRRRVVRPHKERQAEPGHARRAHAMNGDDEVETGKDGAKAGDEDRQAGGNNVGVQVMRAERSGEGPARIDAAERERRQHEDAAENIQIPAQQVDLREGEVFSAHHDRDQEVSDRRRNRRHQKQEDHDDAVHGEHLVIGVRRHQVAGRGQQFQADHPGKKATDKEEDRDRDQIEDRDALVISGEQPALQAVFLVQIGPLRQRLPSAGPEA